MDGLSFYTRTKESVTTKERECWKNEVQVEQNESTIALVRSTTTTNTVLLVLVEEEDDHSKQ